MEQDTRFELALSAWKADVLAADTNPALTGDRKAITCEEIGIKERGKKTYIIFVYTNASILDMLLHDLGMVH